MGRLNNLDLESSSRKDRNSANTSELTSAYTQASSSRVPTLASEHHPPPEYSLSMSSSSHVSTVIPPTTTVPARAPEPIELEQGSPQFPERLPYRPGAGKTWGQRISPNWLNFLLLHYKWFRCHRLPDKRTRGRRVTMVFLLIWRIATFIFMEVMGSIYSGRDYVFYWGDEYYPDDYYDPWFAIWAVVFIVVGILQLWINAWCLALMDNAVADRQRKDGAQRGRGIDAYLGIMAAFYPIGIVLLFIFYYVYIWPFFTWIVAFGFLDLLIAIFANRPRPEVWA